jgi:hypothetical protein
MGSSVSAPRLLDLPGMPVSIPPPECLWDLWHWSDSTLMNAMKFLLLLTDPKTAERNTRQQDQAAAVDRLTKEERELRLSTGLAAFREQYVVVSNAPLKTADTATHGECLAPVDRDYPDWWPRDHVFHVDEVVSELRDVLRFMQDRRPTIAERSAGCCPCCCAPDEEAILRQARATNAMRARGEALVWRGREILQLSRFKPAAMGHSKRVSAGALLPIDPSRMIRFMNLFNDFDLLSKGYVVLRDITRDISTWSSASLTKSLVYPAVMMFSISRDPDRLRYDEFIWTVHNLCVSSDAELIQVCFGYLARAEHDGEPAIDLDSLEGEFPSLLDEEVVAEDKMLRKELFELRERRKAMLSATHYSEFGKFFMIEDFVRSCKDNRLMLFSMRMVRDFFQRRTFSVRYWKNRRKALARAIARGATVLRKERDAAAVVYGLDCRVQLPTRMAAKEGQHVHHAGPMSERLLTHTAVVRSLPCLRHLVEAQACFRDAGHGSRAGRLAIAVIENDDMSGTMMARSLERLRPRWLNERRKATTSDDDDDEDEDVVWEGQETHMRAVAAVHQNRGGPPRSAAQDLAASSPRAGSPVSVRIRSRPSSASRTGSIQFEGQQHRMTRTNF